MLNTLRHPSVTLGSLSSQCATRSQASNFFGRRQTRLTADLFELARHRSPRLQTLELRVQSRPTPPSWDVAEELVWASAEALDGVRAMGAPWDCDCAEEAWRGFVDDAVEESWLAASDDCGFANEDD
jgi:hypothetical protein